MGSFPQFSKLPPEIRRLIWGYYLASVDKPGFAVFNKGYKAQFLHLRSEEDSYLALEDLRPVDPRVFVQVPTPASVYVSREARHVSVAWLAGRGLREMRRSGRRRIWARLFDRERDWVYVPPAEWRRFKDVAELLDEEFEHAVLLAMGDSIRRLALPAFHAYYGIDALRSLLDWMPNLETIASVWNALPDPVLRGTQPVDGYEVQERYELEELGRRDDVDVCYRDPRTGDDYGEGGNLADYVQEIEEQWAAFDEVLPDRFIRLEDGDEVVSMPYVHVRAKKALVDWV